MTTRSKNCFTNLEEEQSTINILKAMEQDSGYNTETFYSSLSEKHPTNIISFTEKHMQYLLTHKGVKPEHYISNLRLKCKVRS